MAAECHAYYDPSSSESICYTGSALNVTLLFEDEAHAGEFMEKLEYVSRNESASVTSMMLESQVSLVSVSVPITRVLVSDYQGEDVDDMTTASLLLNPSRGCS